MRLQKEKVSISVFSDLLTAAQLKFTRVFSNHLQFMTHPHSWRVLMKKLNLKFFSSSKFMLTQQFLPSNEVMENKLIIFLKNYFSSKRISLKMKTSLKVSSLLRKMSFSLANNCSGEECKVLKRLSLLQKTTILPKRTLKNSNKASLRQNQPQILFTIY